MKKLMPALQTATLISASFLATMAVTPLVSYAQDRPPDRAQTPAASTAPTYHDSVRNEDHVWTKDEDKAYRQWEKETHRKHVDFAKAKEDDQQAYWAWRHDHPDKQ